MNTLASSVLAALICITLASDYYGYGLGDHGKGHHGHSYNKGFTKGFEKNGYGEYGSQKYGGWGSHEKAEEHGSHYGSEYDDDHGHGDHDHAGHGHGYKDYYGHPNGDHDGHGNYGYKLPFGYHGGHFGHGYGYGHDHY